MKKPEPSDHDLFRLDIAAYEATQKLYCAFGQFERQQVAYTVAAAAIRALDLEPEDVRAVLHRLVNDLARAAPQRASAVPAPTWPEGASPEDIAGMREVLNLWADTIYATGETLGPNAPAEMVARLMRFPKLPKHIQGPILAEMMTLVLARVGAAFPDGDSVRH